MDLKGRIRGILAFFFLLIPLVYFIVVKNFTSRNPSHSLSKMDVMEDHRYRQVIGAPHMITLDWAKMRPYQLQDIFTFISAYHDNRMDAPGRPAIVILAYIKEKVRRPDLRCLYKFPNGSRKCLRNTIAKVETVDCFASPYNYKFAVFKHILCPLQTISDIPEAIQLSSSVDCKEEGLSNEIMIRNRHTKNQLPTKKIGVCLHSSLRESGFNMQQTVRNFISMCRFLGAGFITMYASPEQVSEKVIMDLLTNYSNEVNLVEWKALNYDYNGQFGIVHDCLYRHMHEADYLAFIDLDEMIIPMRHLNWSDMLDDLEKWGGENYAGYSFLNRMYKPSELEHPELYKCAKIDKDSIYFSWLDERRCIFKHSTRSKVIVSPKHSIHVGIHSVCKFIGEKKLFLVKKELAISAHYRRKNLHSCFNYFSTNKLNHHLYHLLNKYADTSCHDKI